MAGIKKKKGEAGEVKRYITRNAAVKKLQLSLRDFRRICILKGIYPREPRHRKRVQKGDSRIKTLYYLKDIQFLLHEPIIWKFREHRAFMKKMRKAWSRNDKQKSKKLCTQKPFYKLDHIVRERYPTFVNALRDLDDPLTLCFLFSKLPRIHLTPLATIEMCRRLTIEFMHYVIEANALRKVFISIKGYYYQVEIMGQLITWIAPHPFTPRNDTHLDFRVMKIFAEFYITLLGFVNFRLYHSLNIHYPPKLQDMVKSEGEKNMNEIISERVASLNAPLLRNKVDDDEEDGIDTHLFDEDTDQLQAAREEALKKKKQQCLFKGLKFFLNRETNLESLTFVIRACQGQVSWDESTAEGSTYPMTDESITHEIVDRPQKTQKYLSRYYIQPQWVYDCINARILLPVQEYFPGVTLPAHLSPFTIETATTTALYVPPEKKKLEALQRGDLPLDQLQDVEDSEDEDSEAEEIKESETTVEENKDKKCDVELEEIEEEKEEAVQNPSTEKMSVHEGSEFKVKKSEKDRREKEETRLSVMMIPRKQKRLYRILRRKERKDAEKVVRLTNKRKIIDEKEKQKKKKSKTIENSQKKSVVKI